MTTLAVDDLTFGYGRVAVGSHVTFDCTSGEALALLGPNGSGKTTLFKTLLGLLPPLAGRVTIDGEDTAGWSPLRRALTFGYVPQASPGFFPFTVREAVLMGRTARIGAFSAPSAHDRAVVVEAMSALGISHLAERDFTRISGGERQLALIARSLAQEPAFLVLDEPTASLDFGNQLLVLDTVRALTGRGLGIVLSTHHPDQAFACTDKVALMKDGRLTALGPTADTLNAETLSGLYGVPLGVGRIDGWTVSYPARPAAFDRHEG